MNWYHAELDALKSAFPPAQESTEGEHALIFGARVLVWDAGNTDPATAGRIIANVRAMLQDVIDGTEPFSADNETACELADFIDELEQQI